MSAGDLLSILLSRTIKASVIGNTVGDPLKDTVGPSLDILKLVDRTAVPLAPLIAMTLLG